MDEDQGPSQVVPAPGAHRSIGDRMRGILKTFTTKEGLLGDYDYAFLFRPNLPFMRKTAQAAPFFGLNQKMPVFLGLLLGFQHSLAMLAGIIVSSVWSRGTEISPHLPGMPKTDNNKTPPLILSSSANLDLAQQQYLVSTALIVSGLLSMIQITRFHIWKTP
jgi:uric acid-xanthine permease